MGTVRQVVSCAFDEPENVVAEFQLIEGRVIARYPRDVLGLARQLFEEDGLVVFDRVVRIADGAAFLEALERGLANASRWYVREVAH